MEMAKSSDDIADLKGEDPPRDPPKAIELPFRNSNGGPMCDVTSVHAVIYRKECEERGMLDPHRQWQSDILKTAKRAQCVM